MKPNLKKKSIIAILSLIALFGTGLSCGGGGQPGQTQSVTLKFWKPFDSSDKWQEIISAFATTHQGVIIEYTQKSSETYPQDLVDAMAAGQGPDIFSIRNDWLGRFRDKISPLSGDQFPVRTYRETFADVVSQDFVEGNQIFAIPASVDVLGLYYNRGLLSSAGIARPPSTWPELTSMIPKITKFNSSGQITRAGIAMGLANNINRSSDILTLLMLQSGTKFYDDSQASVTLSRGTADENQETPAARSLRFYTQFADPSSKAYAWNSKQIDSIDSFVQNQTVMIFGYSYLMPQLKAKDAFLDYGVAGVPQLTLSGTKVNIASYWAETVWGGSKNQRLAWEFIQFANSFEQNKKYNELTGQLSSRKDVLSNQQRDPELGVFAENALSAKSVSKPEVGQFEKILNEAIEDVAFGSVQPQEAIEKAERKLQLLLERYPLKKAL